MTSKLSDQIYEELKTTNKLTDVYNYFSWRNKLYILLQELSTGYVLTHPMPPVPQPGSAQATFDTYHNWIYYDECCRQIIASVVDEPLSLILYNLPTAKSYMDALKTRFESIPFKKVDILRSYLDHRMTNKTPIKCHVSNMGKVAFDVEMAGFVLPEETKIEIFKNSLADSWKDTADGVIADRKNGLMFDTVIEWLRSVDPTRRRLSKQRDVEIARLRTTCILEAFLLSSYW